MISSADGEDRFPVVATAWPALYDDEGWQSMYDRYEETAHHVNGKLEPYNTTSLLKDIHLTESIILLSEKLCQQLA